MWIVGVVSRRWVWLVGVVVRRYTVEPLLTDPPRSGQPPNNGQTQGTD